MDSVSNFYTCLGDHHHHHHVLRSVAHSLTAPLYAAQSTNHEDDDDDDDVDDDVLRFLAKWIGGTLKEKEFEGSLAARP